MSYTVHAFAAEWPALAGDELERITNSIKARGQRQPILVRKSDNILIDGRNRLAACEAAGVEPVIEIVDASEEETLDLIADLNGCRRHLNESQRAMLGAKYVAAKKAARELILNLETKSNRPDTGVVEATKEAAAKFNVAESSVHKARAVDKKSPELPKPVARGEETLHSATEKLAKPKAKPKQHAIVNPDVDADMEHPDEVARDPGEDDVEVKPKPKGKPTESDKAIDKLSGQLIRAIDNKARVDFKVQGKNHAACIKAMYSVGDAVRAWKEAGTP